MKNCRKLGKASLKRKERVYLFEPLIFKNLWYIGSVSRKLTYFFFVFSCKRSNCGFLRIINISVHSLQFLGGSLMQKKKSLLSVSLLFPPAAVHYSLTACELKLPNNTCTNLTSNRGTFNWFLWYN